MRWRPVGHRPREGGYGTAPQGCLGVKRAAGSTDTRVEAIHICATPPQPWRWRSGSPRGAHPGMSREASKPHGI
ncbi:MAG: hypothetical protein QW176_05015 [Candidatus Bathyarchaeia archaeon]